MDIAVLMVQLELETMWICENHVLGHRETNG